MMFEEWLQESIAQQRMHVRFAVIQDIELPSAFGPLTL
jgi:hypothetical protein